MYFNNYDQLIANGQTPDLQKKRKDVLDILSAALDAVNPYKAVKKVFVNNQIVFEEESFDLSGFDNIFVVGFGKASIGMTQAVQDSVTITKGAVVTNDPSAKLPSENIETVVGGHPIPNEGSIEGAKKISEVVNHCGENDLLIVLISGGGSALLCNPRVSLSDLQETTDLLLKCGADINEINTIRKHLSYVKGGQLVQNAKGVVISLVISDIVHDPLEFISSGPTYPDSTTFSDAKSILEKYDLWEKVPEAVRNIIEQGENGAIAETPKKGDAVFTNVYNYIVANNTIACSAAEGKAKSLGYEPTLLTTSLTGEAKDIGRMLAAKAKHSSSGRNVFISGGETTVTIKGDGKGGRNQELVLASIEEIKEKTVVASFATDGIDGTCNAAGAIADGHTLSRAQEKGLNPHIFLADNDSYTFFSELQDIFLTGPTGTNVMDLHILVV